MPGLSNVGAPDFESTKPPVGDKSPNSKLKEPWGTLVAQALCFKNIELHEDMFVFGRNVNNEYLEKDLVNRKFFNTLSRKQFTIVKTESKVEITDHSSTGTFIQKRKLGINQTTDLKHNDIISVGSEEFECFCFKIASESGAHESMTIETPKTTKKSTQSDETIFGVKFGLNNTSYGSLFSRSLSRTPSKKTQRSESDDSINLDEKKTRQKNPVKDYDSLTGMSKDNGSTVSESHVTKSTFGVDDESIIETGRRKRNRKKKKDPEFEYFG